MVVFMCVYMFIDKKLEKTGENDNNKRCALIVGKGISTTLAGIFLAGELTLLVSALTISSEYNITDYTEYTVSQIFQFPERVVILYDDNKKIVITEKSILSDDPVLRVSETNSDNVIREETVRHDMDWFCKIGIVADKTHVYLSEDLYDTIYNHFCNVIYP